MNIYIIRHAEPDYEHDSLTEKGWRLLTGPDEGFFSTSSCHLPRAGKGVTSTIR